MLNLVNIKPQTPTMKLPRIKKLIQFDVDIWLNKNKLPIDQLDLHFKKCTNCSYYVETIELFEKKTIHGKSYKDICSDCNYVLHNYV